MRIDHVNVRCTRLATTADFLCSAVGLRPGPRPDFAFPGQWLYDDSGRAVLHLIQASQPLGEAGAVDHVAFFYDDLPAQMRHLQQLGHACVARVVPGTDIQQCFVQGPDGLKIEFQGPCPTPPATPNGRGSP